MKKFLLLTICTTALLCNCSKKETEDVTIKMLFKETQCSNPWDALPESENYLNEVRDYLKENKIYVEKIYINRFTDAPAYGGCTVLSGRRIYIELLNKYETKAATLGFITY